MEHGLEQVRRFMVEGGPVMAPLVLVGVLLWYFLLSRSLILRRGVRGNLETVVRRAAIEPPPRSRQGIIGSAIDRASRLARFHEVDHDELEVIVSRGRLETRRHTKLIGTLVAAAPLLGLLGTVSGMMETFASLTDMAMFSRTGGGISGGISEALMTTQLGLGIAIPGLLAAQLLEGRARRLRDELDRLAPILAGIGEAIRRANR